MPRLTSRFTAVDRIYFVYFTVLTLAIAIFHARVHLWPFMIVANAGVIVSIVMLAYSESGSRVGAFLHDWYPLIIFIIAFEESARLSHMIVPLWRDGWLLAVEGKLFSVPPTVWLDRFASTALTEILEIGYFSYFLLLPVVGGVLYARGRRSEFRSLMTASVFSYVVCYVIFILLPMEGPRYTLAALHSVVLGGGPFHWMVTRLQGHAGVHGNAFPSAHVANGFVCLVFAWKYIRRLAPVISVLVLLLSVGAVYDWYHYASDVIAGALLGTSVAFVTIHYRWGAGSEKPLAQVVNSSAWN
jgi:membrane-associated phospholipid phosphatase